MIIAPGNASSSMSGRIRPMNLARDVGQVLSLLNLVFSPTLDADERRALNLRGNSSYVITRLNHFATGVTPGFVWEEEGRIVGHVSIMPTRTAGRLIIANVAVHPDYRRRGIARALMEASLDHIAAQRAHTVVLQVAVDNPGARSLYAQLGFHDVGVTRVWTTTMSRLRELPTKNSYDIRPLRGSEHRLAYELDITAFPIDLNWPEPVQRGAYRQGLWRWWDNVTNGRQSEVWVIPDTKDKPLGLAAIWSEWGRSHRLTLRVPEPWRAELTRPLLAKLLRRLRYLRRRSVQIEHLSHDEQVNRLLEAANFRPKRELTTMRLELGRG